MTLYNKGVCFLLIILYSVLAMPATIFDCKCQGEVCQMRLMEASVSNMCRSTNTTKLTLPDGLFDPNQRQVKLVLRNLNLTSTANAFNNNSEALKKIVSIDLSGNRLTVLKDGLQAAKNLTELNVSHNKLTSISKTFFNGLKKLSHLNLSSNKLENFAVFFYVPNLVSLDLHSNVFRQMDVCSFAPIQSLKKLFLQSNDIQSINLESINCNNGLSGIEELYLQNNRIANITGLARFYKLVTLDLSNNQNLRLTPRPFFQWDALENLIIDNIDLKESANFTVSLQDVAPTLRELSVSNNNLERFNVADYPRLNKLTTLWIEDNRLSEFDYKLLRSKFPNITWIGITGNRWDCKYLISMLEDLTLQDIELLNFDRLSACIDGDSGVGFYYLVLIGLCVAIVFVAMSLFFVQIYRNQPEILQEQRQLQERIRPDRLSRYCK